MLQIAVMLGMQNNARLNAFYMKIFTCFKHTSADKLKRHLVLISLNPWRWFVLGFRIGIRNVMKHYDIKYIFALFNDRDL